MVAHCVDCGTEVGTADNFCPACGFQLEDAETRQPTLGQSGSGWWYLGVSFPLLTTAAMLVMSFSIGFLIGAGALAEPTGDGWVDVIGALWALSLVLSVVLTPVSLHFDRQYLSRTRGWTPHVAYYAVVIPLVNVFLGAVYLAQRYRSRTRPGDS